MVRKKARRSAFVSDSCFFLLRLKHELQNDARVVKAVVNEVDVLRLFHSLGMAVSDEGNRVAMRDFQFGLFSPSSYDADFARFIREKLAADCATNQEDQQLEIGCLFGRQCGVKAELTRMGLWRSIWSLSLTEQGVYCIEKGGGGGGHRQFIAFAWLNTSLFEPDTIRETPAYVLRFLMSLSSSISCCLSRDDFHLLKREVDAASSGATMQWNSCSVAFRVQKQEKQSDSVRCAKPTKAVLPSSDPIEGVEFIGGVFPAVAVESAAPSTTEWVTNNASVSIDDFADWVMELHSRFKVELPRDSLRPALVRDSLLEKFDSFPNDEKDKFRKSFEDKIAKAKQRIDRDVSEKTQELHKVMGQNADMLFAVRTPAKASRMEKAREQYNELMQMLDSHDVLSDLDDKMRIALRMPERMQANMEALHEAYVNNSSRYEALLNEVANGTPVETADNSSRGGWWKALGGATRGVFRWMRSGNEQFSEFSVNFILALESRQSRLQRHWIDAVEHAASKLGSAMRGQRVFQSTNDRKLQWEQGVERVFDEAYLNLRSHLLSSNEHPLCAKISSIRLNHDDSAANVKWSEEVEKDPTKVIRVYELSHNRPSQMSLMGTVQFKAGVELRKLTTVKTNQLVAVVVEDGRTIVRRIQFPVDLDALNEVDAHQLDVRTFPHACGLCCIRASDRRVVFTREAGNQRLGTAVFYRLNESFTSIQPTRGSIDMDATFGLTAPTADIILTERSLCALDARGGFQSYDLCTRQISRMVQLGDNSWVGSLLCFADELVLGRARVEESGRLVVSSISSEDHRKLPTAVLEGVSLKGSMSVGCIGDVLYVVDAGARAVYASELSVTVRSEAYRIQRSGKGAKADRGWLRADQNQPSDALEHWLRVFYHVFEKFPVRSLIDSAMDPEPACPLQIGVVFTDDQDEAFEADAARVCKAYFNNLMEDLRRLNKPLAGLDLASTLRCQGLAETRELLEKVAIRRVLSSVVSFVPVQICRAEDNMLRLLQDGEDNTSNASRGDNTSESSESAVTEASEIAQSIRFGLLSPLLESWSGRCVVVTSMGKQSTGKSYFLNHLTGATFAISGSRCTDGAWMSLRFLSTDTLLVVLDFEGLGSFERSEQEDIFLSVLNASVSMFTVFRMESRFDKDIDGLFSRFQKGVQLIKNDARLFRGLLFMSVKDVNMNDRQGVVDELATKLNAIFDSSREHNFLTEMYAGQVEINCTPPFGTREYYQSMENDAAKRLLEIVSPLESAGGGFSTGKAFLDCLRIVLAKISILDWTSMDKNTQNLVVSDVMQKLPGILRTGCHVPQSLVAEPTISPQMKEVVLQVGSQKKVSISFEEVCQTYPGNAMKWKTLNRVVALDEITDETIDFGFDVAAIEDRGLKTIQRILVALFHKFLALGYKEKDCARLTTENQKRFDDFVAFVLRRRKMKVSLWLRGALDDRLSETRSKLEQRYVDQLVIFLSRCQHRCASCQLGCMHSATHSTEIQHHCGTNHKCRGSCEYAECRDGSESIAPPCSRSAGHEGKCECEKGEHTCGQLCVLARAFNCDRTCSKLAEHPGNHRCSVRVHTCGAPCSAETCKAACVLNIQRRHVVHKCVEIQCLHECCMHGCRNICGEKNHFHGQADESRAFAEENGMTYSPNLSEDSVDNEDSPVTHMCLGSHACPELCQVSGMCEQKVHLKKSSRTYEGARGSFEYVYQEMNGCKKQCICVVPGGRRNHDPLEHSCVAPTESAIEFSSIEDHHTQTIHYCDVRCPCCDYYCNKPFGHMGLHDTSHGNMRRTYFLAKSNDIDLEDRKYQVGERGVAEMCNLFCSKMGRGHIHYLSCEGKGREHCVYTADASEDRRRHCEDELYPPPGKAMDELLHCRFWPTIGWEDPCSEEERALFAKCPFQCDAPEHEEADKAPSYCTLEAWHLPEMKPEVDDGFAYIHGHKFECVHAVDSGKFHNIFVLDNSGSMSGQPWKNLLCACNEFGINRLQDGGEGDLVSYITFSNRSIIHCEGKPLEEALKMKLPYSGGGTSFEVALRAANEVLSRNDHKHFKTVVIFFSDGHPRDINVALAIAQGIRSTYAKYDLKAFVVGFGHVNLSVLERMAVEMGGEYRHVLDANELQKEFQRIGAVLRKSEASLALVEA